jgi:RraA family protein
MSHARRCALEFVRAAERRAARAWTARSTRSTTTNTTPTTPLPLANASRFGTADVCDVHHPESVDDATTARSVRVATPNYFKDYGGRRRFHGEVTTVLCYENNPLVRAALEEPGNGRVLVVDGGASPRCALLGDNLAEMAAMNGWSGVIVNGCVRDSDDIARFDVGVKAIGTHPLKSSKRDPGRRDVRVSFAGVDFEPGSYVYADADGVVVAAKKLEL